MAYKAITLLSTRRVRIRSLVLGQANSWDRCVVSIGKGKISKEDHILAIRLRCVLAVVYVERRL